MLADLCISTKKWHRQEEDKLSEYKLQTKLKKRRANTNLVIIGAIIVIIIIDDIEHIDKMKQKVIILITKTTQEGDRGGEEKHI